jgi:ATP/maltotriose-dependent transcriptional regulator MalT
VALARVLWDVGDLRRSRELVDEVLASDVAGPMRVAALVLDGMHRLWSIGPEASIESFTAALPHAAGHPVLEAIVHLRIAYASDDELAAVERHADAAVTLLDGRAGAEDLLASALLLRSEARFLAGVSYDDRAVERGRALLRAKPRPLDLLISFDGRAVARERSWLLRALTDELAAARGELEALRRDDAELGRDRSAPIAHADLAELCCWLGDASAARAHAEEAQEIVRQTGGTPYAVAASLLASALVAEHEGDLRRAQSTGQDALERAEGLGPSPLTDRTHALLGRVALQTGRPSAAADEFAVVDARLRSAGLRHPLVYRFRGDHLEALVLAGQLDEARADLSRLEDAAAQYPTPWSTAVAARTRALIGAAMGDVGEAVRELEAALEQDGLALPVERGRTELLLGRLRRRQRQKRSAAQALERAAATFEAAGAMGWAAIARRELDRLGRRTLSADELTVTEREVARLAAGGMTNRQVADALVLSPKTIDGTLTRVYGKLGIHTRAELGALLGRTSVSE